MCTVTWLRTDQGFELFCSRDEKRTRALAHGPEKRYRDGVAFLAPLDGEAQGTWIAVNEFGLALCLLNGKPSSVDPDARISSRGSLVWQLAACRGRSGVLQRLQRLDLHPYQGFSLLLLQDSGAASLAEWDGSDLKICADASARMPLVSSSYLFDETVRVRRLLFVEMIAGSDRLTTSTLEKFHTSHRPEPGPFSICMHRADARTHSLSRVSVGSAMSTLTYWDDAPCQAESPVSVSIPRRREFPMSIPSTVSGADRLGSGSRQTLC